MEQAHRQAYDKICITIDLKLIHKQGIMKMSDLLLRYTKELDKTPFPNPDYRSENLKAKLMTSYQESISLFSMATRTNIFSTVQQFPLEPL